MKSNRIIYVIGRAAVACFVLCGMWSCGIYGTFKTPEYEMTADAYGDIVPQDSTSIGDVDWRDFFTDQYLCALIDTALQNNYDMRNAMLQVEQAQASLKASKLAYVPSFAFAPNETFNAVQGGGAGVWATQLPVNASWTVDIFGSLRNAKRQQQAVLMQSEAYAQAVRSQLIATVATTYYSLLALDAQYDIYLATEQSWRQNVEVTRKLMEAGKANAASLAQTEANYYNVANGLVDIRQQVIQMENTLCSLLGQTPHEVERGTIEGWQGPEVITTGVAVEVLSNRPDVRQAEQALAQAFYGTNGARSAFYPAITITGSATHNLTDLLYNAVGSLVQPIFQQGKLRANLKIAKAQQEAAELAFKQTLVDAGIEVNDAFVAVNAAREKADNYRKQVERLEEAVRSTQLLMTYGSTTYLEVLTAQQTLLTAQISEVTNRLSEISGVITLYQALGGGSVDTAVENAEE